MNDTSIHFWSTECIHVKSISFVIVLMNCYVDVKVPGLCRLYWHKYFSLTYDDYHTYGTFGKVNPAFFHYKQISKVRLKCEHNRIRTIKILPMNVTKRYLNNIPDNITIILISIICSLWQMWKPSSNRQHGITGMKNVAFRGYH